MKYIHLLMPLTLCVLSMQASHNTASTQKKSNLAARMQSEADAGVLCDPDFEHAPYLQDIPTPSLRSQKPSPYNSYPESESETADAASRVPGSPEPSDNEDNDTPEFYVTKNKVNSKPSLSTAPKSFTAGHPAAQPSLSQTPLNPDVPSATPVSPLASQTMPTFRGQQDTPSQPSAHNTRTDGNPLLHSTKRSLEQHRDLLQLTELVVEMNEKINSNLRSKKVEEAEMSMEQEFLQSQESSSSEETSDDEDDDGFSTEKRRAIRNDLLNFFTQFYPLDHYKNLSELSEEEFSQQVQDHYADIVLVMRSKIIKKAQENHASHPAYAGLQAAQILSSCSAEWSAENSQENQKNVIDHDEKMQVIKDTLTKASCQIAQELLPTSFRMSILPLSYKCGLGTLCGLAGVGIYKLGTLLLSTTQESEDTADHVISAPLPTAQTA